MITRFIKDHNRSVSHYRSLQIGSTGSEGDRYEVILMVKNGPTIPVGLKRILLLISRRTGFIDSHKLSSRN